MNAAPTLYFDLGSPYAYLAVERVESVLGRAPELQPVLLGAIFTWRGRGSWAHAPKRDRNVAEIERRARAYALPPIVWPPAWPTDGLAAMRAATWAKQQGGVREFVSEVFRAQFARGADIADLNVLAACAQRAGLNADALRRSLGNADTKTSLRQATQAAWDGGVRGVPSLRIAETVFYGDDQLELAARRLTPPEASQACTCWFARANCSTIAGPNAGRSAGERLVVSWPSITTSSSTTSAPALRKSQSDGVESA